MMHIILPIPALLLPCCDLSPLPYTRTSVGRGVPRRAGAGGRAHSHPPPSGPAATTAVEDDYANAYLPRAALEASAGRQLGGTGDQTDRLEAPDTGLEDADGGRTRSAVSLHTSSSRSSDSDDGGGGGGGGLEEDAFDYSSPSVRLSDIEEGGAGEGGGGGGAGGSSSDGGVITASSSGDDSGDEDFGGRQRRAERRSERRERRARRRLRGSSAVQDGNGPGVTLRPRNRIRAAVRYTESASEQLEGGEGGTLDDGDQLEEGPAARPTRFGGMHG
jgi:hypothetical protein